MSWPRSNASARQQPCRGSRGTLTRRHIFPHIAQPVLHSFWYALYDMKPAPFRYVAARSIEQALTLKAEHGDEARFLAGGQSLVPTMNFRLTQPAMLIDINPLDELAGVENGGGERLTIGALTRYRSLERNPATARHLPLVHEALPYIAHPQIRN